MHQGTHRQHETEVDTEAGMLSGVSRKRSIRSSPCWFTEFCKSQCLSHFAAPFIVVRAETSVAESCKYSQKAAQARVHEAQHACGIRKRRRQEQRVCPQTTDALPPLSTRRGQARGAQSKSSHLGVQSDANGFIVCE